MTFCLLSNLRLPSLPVLRTNVSECRLSLSAESRAFVSQCSSMDPEFLRITDALLIPVVPIIIGDELLSRHNDGMLGRYGTMQPGCQDTTTPAATTVQPTTQCGSRWRRAPAAGARADTT